MRFLTVVLFLVSLSFPEVVARLNGREITRDEFRKAFEIYWREVLHFNAGRPTPEDRKRFLFEYLKGMIVEDLAGDMGIHVSEAEVKERLRRWGRRSADPVITQLVRRELLLERIEERLTADLEVTEEEIRVYYLLNRREFYLPEQIKLLRVVVADREEAERVYRTLKQQGKIPPDGQIRIGKERWYSVQSLPRRIRSRLFPYRKGTVSRPIRLETGYLLLKITDRRKAGFIPLDEVRERVRQKILRVKKEEVLRSWFRDILKGYRLELYLQNLE